MLLHFCLLVGSSLSLCSSVMLFKLKKGKKSSQHLTKMILIVNEVKLVKMRKKLYNILKLNTIHILHFRALSSLQDAYACSTCVNVRSVFWLNVFLSIDIIQRFRACKISENGEICLFAVNFSIKCIISYSFLM